MMGMLRRMFVVAAFAFWQGGFTFYAAVVVPIGRQVLGSAKEQGFITRQVTVYMNLAGGCALALFAWDIAGAKDPAAWRRRLRWVTWLGMVLALAILFWLHPHLDQMLDPETWGIFDRPNFRTYHRWYLWISTVQCGLGLVFLALTVYAWRDSNSGAGQGSAEGGTRTRTPFGTGS